MLDTLLRTGHRSLPPAHGPAHGSHLGQITAIMRRRVLKYVEATLCFVGTLLTANSGLGH